MRTLVERASRWLVNNRRPPLDSEGTVDFFGVAGRSRSMAALPELLTGREPTAFEARRDALVDAGRARGPGRPGGGAAAGVHAARHRRDRRRATALDPLEVARVHFALGERLGLPDAGRADPGAAARRPLADDGPGRAARRPARRARPAHRPGAARPPPPTTPRRPGSPTGRRTTRVVVAAGGRDAGGDLRRRRRPTWPGSRSGLRVVRGLLARPDSGTSTPTSGRSQDPLPGLKDFVQGRWCVVSSTKRCHIHSAASVAVPTATRPPASTRCGGCAATSGPTCSALVDHARSPRSAGVGAGDRDPAGHQGAHRRPDRRPRDRARVLPLGPARAGLGVLEAVLIFVRRWVQSNAVLGVETDDAPRPLRAAAAAADELPRPVAVRPAALPGRPPTCRAIRRFLGFGLLFLVINILQVIVVTVRAAAHVLAARPGRRRRRRCRSSGCSMRFEKALRRRLAARAGPAGRPRHARRGGRGRHPGDQVLRPQPSTSPASYDDAAPHAARHQHGQGPARRRGSGPSSRSSPTSPSSSCCCSARSASATARSPPATLVAFITLMLSLVWPVASLGVILAMAQEAMTAAARILEIFDTEPDIVAGDRGRRAPARPPALRARRLRLPRRARRAGAARRQPRRRARARRVALVGATGSGKTIADRPGPAALRRHRRPGHPRRRRRPRPRRSTSCARWSRPRSRSRRCSR